MEPSSPSPIAAGCVVTGVGIECGFGDLAATWDGLSAGRSAVAMTTLPGVDGSPSLPAAPSLGTDPALTRKSRKLIKYMSPAVRMAVVAAGRALADAGLAEDAERCDRTALYLATDLIAFDPTEVAVAVDNAKSERGELDLERLGREGLRRCHPLLPFKILLNMPLGMVSIVYGLRGENAVFYPDAGQGGASLAAAVRAIQSGRCERVLCGATSNGVSLLPAATLARLDLLAGSPAAAMAYHEGHRGFAPGDAAAFLLLESARACRERGADARAELQVATSQLYQPFDAGQRFAARRALWGRMAREPPPDLLVSSGNLDAGDDQAELAALASLWPGERPRVTSVDGQLGFVRAAAPSLAVALATRMLQRQETVGLPEPGGGRFSSSRLLVGSDPVTPLDRIAVSAGDPAGGSVVAWLDRAGGSR